VGSGSYSINTRWYLELNTVARHSTWAHGVMETYSHDLGIGLLALVLLGAWWWARRAPDPARSVAAVLWAAGGTVVAWVIAHYGLKPLVAERRPYLALPHVEVLLTRTNGYSFPSGHATVAGAVMVGLMLARRPIAAALAVVLGLLLGFGRVYTGMHYPFDVVGGLVVGAAVVAVLWPLAVPLLARFDERLLRTPLAWLVATAANRPTGAEGLDDQRVRSATAVSSAAASSGESGQ
jgi:undecaprenyl-diphosphatase